MKTPYLMLAIFSISGTIAVAQTQVVSVDESSSLVVSEIGAHHRVFQRVTAEMEEEGKTIYRTNSDYIKLETGMNVEQHDGSWVEASDEIEITATGGIGRKARHQVIFAGNCNS